MLRSVSFLMMTLTLRAAEHSASCSEARQKSNRKSALAANPRKRTRSRELPKSKNTSHLHKNLVRTPRHSMVRDRFSGSFHSPALLVSRRRLRMTDNKFVAYWISVISAIRGRTFLLHRAAVTARVERVAHVQHDLLVQRRVVNRHQSRIETAVDDGSRSEERRFRRSDDLAVGEQLEHHALVIKLDVRVLPSAIEMRSAIPAHHSSLEL